MPPSHVQSYENYFNLKGRVMDCLRDDIDTEIERVHVELDALNVEKDEILLQTKCQAAFNYFSKKYDTWIDDLNTYVGALHQKRDEIYPKEQPKRPKKMNLTRKI